MTRLSTKLRHLRESAAGPRPGQDGPTPEAVVFSSFDEDGCLPTKPPAGHLRVLVVSIEGAERTKAHGRFDEAADGTPAVSSL